MPIPKAMVVACDPYGLCALEYVILLSEPFSTALMLQQMAAMEPASILDEPAVSTPRRRLMDAQSLGELLRVSPGESTAFAGMVHHHHQLHDCLDDLSCLPTF
jgi:hypothetical protein